MCGVTFPARYARCVTKYMSQHDPLGMTVFGKRLAERNPLVYAMMVLHTLPQKKSESA